MRYESDDIGDIINCLRRSAHPPSGWQLDCLRDLWGDALCFRESEWYTELLSVCPDFQYTVGDFFGPFPWGAEVKYGLILQAQDVRGSPDGLWSMLEHHWYSHCDDDGKEVLDLFLWGRRMFGKLDVRVLPFDWPTGTTGHAFSFLSGEDYSGEVLHGHSSMKPRWFWRDVFRDLIDGVYSGAVVDHMRGVCTEALRRWLVEEKKSEVL